MSKKPYKKTYVSSYGHIFSQIIEITNKLLCELDEFTSMDITEEWQEKFHNIFGEKENIVSILNKLTIIITKIIPMEQKIMSDIINKTTQDQNETKLPPEDIAIIERYLEKIQHTKENISQDQDNVSPVDNK